MSQFEINSSLNFVDIQFMGYSWTLKLPNISPKRLLTAYASVENLRSISDIESEKCPLKRERKRLSGQFPGSHTTLLQ